MLQSASECLACETSYYCTGGQLSGFCRAGYWCLSGAKSDIPVTTAIFEDCLPGDECAGMCKTGHYCENGTLIPTPCPELTYRNETGGQQLSDCAICPAGYICQNATTDPTLCIPGHYCPEGMEPQPCPVNTYQDSFGTQWKIQDCIACESGYICNETGMTNYTRYPCPAGFYCYRGEDPALCPAGTMRNRTGAGQPSDCPLCRAGFYCPNDTINTHGIPCDPTYECPEGAALQVDCRPGHYCEGETGVPPICPAGYYCPGATEWPLNCSFPDYCPEGSNMTMQCDLGYRARDHNGIRYDESISCEICPPGTYGNRTDRSACDLCPAGYFCPAGTGNGDENPCEKGYYCPAGAADQTACPAGHYGTIELATSIDDCSKCRANSFQNRPGKTKCRPCGGTSGSEPGSASCTCVGKFRNFQKSGKYCVCEGGYHYYNEADKKFTDKDGREDCQKIVYPRCSGHETRHASTGQCVNPDTYDCTQERKCQNSGGCYYDSNFGNAFCNDYTSADSICDANCQSTTQPTVTGGLQTDGTVGVNVYDPVTGTTSAQTIPNTLGPVETAMNVEGPIFSVSFWGLDIGCSASVFRDNTDTDYLFQSIPDILSSLNAVGRRRLLANSIPATEITNPVMCLELEEMVIFKLLVNDTDRSLSHYPVYKKDHLFSTNANFDYGPFLQLQDLIVNTNANISNFAFVFSEAGNYVFEDAQDSSLQILINVEPSGSTCPGTSRINPATPGNLGYYGFAKQAVGNEEPDWMLIWAMIAFFLLLVALLVLAIFIWMPRNAGIYPMKHWAPKYRSLGKPPPVPSYLRYDTDHWPQKPPLELNVVETLGPRLTGDGAEKELMSAPLAGEVGMKAFEGELEEFNVRVFYDKLEDQNLHLASQLAAQKEDLRKFYDKMHEQNEGLKQLLLNLDPVKLEELQQRMEEREKRLQARFQGASDGGPTIINTNLTMGAAGRHNFSGTSAGNREAELIAALQLLLDRMNSGNVPINKNILEQLQKSGGGDGAGMGLSNVNYTTAGGQGSGISKNWAELLRRHNGERLKLERDLLKEEQAAIAQFVEEEENKRKQTVDSMTDGLMTSLHGDMKAAEVADIMNKYSKNLETTMNKHNDTKQRQADELHRKLAQRRKGREDALRDKQAKEAEHNGLPTPPVRADNSGTKLKMSQSVLDTLQAEEASGLAKTETDIDHSLGDEERRQLSEKLKEHMDRMSSQGVLTQELKDKLLQQHKDAESSLSQVHEARRQQQVKNLQDKMAQRRKRKFDKLRDDQEKYKNEVTARMIQEGRNDELERELESLKRLFEQEMAAAEAEVDAEENEHLQKMTKTLSDEHTQGLKEKQRDILKAIKDQCPEAEHIAMNRLMDQHRRDVESLEQELSLERDRQLSDIQAKLASRRARRLAESQRKMEEEEAQRVVSEQRKQMQQQQEGAGRPGAGDGMQAQDSGLLVAPKLTYGESTEEQALKKQQERNKEGLRKQQEKDHETTVSKLDEDAEKQEEALKKQLQEERNKILLEKKNKLATELEARNDLNEDQLAALMAQHEHELEELADRLDKEKDRQLFGLRMKLDNRRQRKLEDLRRKHDVDMAKEMLEQKKELNEIRLKKAIDTERKAIQEGIKDNGEEESEKVIKAVLAQRQAQEMNDLEKQFAAERRMMVDDALNKLNDKYDKLRDEMTKRQGKELRDLMKQDLSTETLQERRAELLNKHQQELSALDRRQASEKGDVESGALADCELKFAKAKLALKEKHYKEYADALREFSSDKTAAKDAVQSALELEDMKKKLEHERKEQEEKLKKEQKEFEREEQKRMEEEMGRYARELEEETNKEKDKYEKNMETLEKRKEEIIKKKRQQMMDEVEKLRAQGASEHDQEELMEQHERNLQTILNRMAADKIRMQSTLQEKLRKRREEKLRAKQNELVNNAEDAKREMEHQQQSQLQRMKADEALTLNEALNIDTANSQAMLSAGPDRGKERAAPDLPPSYNMATPLNERELMALLMASPLYQKLENIRKTFEKGNGGSAEGKESTKSDGFQDAKDSQWGQDSKLEPVDLNKLNARSFIVYKFGCFVSELVAAHCQHVPVTILLADKIPPNTNLGRNPFRNSFYYDANNHILYIRTARLESVGEFIVVLVHTLAHIKSGDLRDDHNPDFLREYHRALSVVCSDLFFARFRRSTHPRTDNVQGALQLLQSMFGECHTEDEKVKMVDDLLDVKLLPATSVEGVHFNTERLRERLSKYSSFSMTNRLHTMLGSMEDKVHQAKSQGSTHNVDSLLSRSQKYSPSGSSMMSRRLPLRFVTANMTGHALWQTFANHDDDPDKTDGEMPEKMSNEDKHDELCADFSDVNKQILNIKQRVESLTEEVSSQARQAEKSKGKGMKSDVLSSASEQLAELRAELTRLEMEKKQISDKLEQLQ